MASPETRTPYRSIISISRESDISDQLRSSENIRYARYRTTESPEEFATLLGDDVRFATHPKVTYKIARSFINSQNKGDSSEHISDVERDLIYTASLVHDWGELKIDGQGCGDKTFDQHTLTDEQEEGIIFEKLISRMKDVPDREYVSRAYREVVEDKTSKLGRMFNAIEKIGYLNTALRAYLGFNGIRIANWKGLVGNVFSNQIIPLLGYQKDYNLVRETFERNFQVIFQAFQDISGENIPPDHEGKPSFDKDKLIQARIAWESALGA